MAVARQQTFCHFLPSTVQLPVNSRPVMSPSRRVLPDHIRMPARPPLLRLPVLHSSTRNTGVRVGIEVLTFCKAGWLTVIMRFSLPG